MPLSYVIKGPFIRTLRSSFQMSEKGAGIIQKGTGDQIMFCVLKMNLFHGIVRNLVDSGPGIGHEHWGMGRHDELGNMVPEVFLYKVEQRQLFGRGECGFGFVQQIDATLMYPIVHYLEVGLPV